MYGFAKRFVQEVSLIKNTRLWSVSTILKKLYKSMNGVVFQPYKVQLTRVTITVYNYTCI